MKASSVREMGPEELSEKVKELKAELFNLRFQLATGQLQNTMAITNVKRDIARCKTILHQQKGVSHV